MSARLIRALQRGGCAIELPGGDWAVRRGEDARGRAIGKLRAATVEMMRLRGDLALAGGASDGRLIWAGAVAPLQDSRCSSAAWIEDPEPASPRVRPLLQRVLEDRTQHPERRRLAQAARDFSEDIARRQSGGWARGMNWQAIESGMRVDGGGSKAPDGRIGYAMTAAQRLERLEALMSLRQVRLLEKLIIEFETRKAVARWLGLRPKQAEYRALRALRDLADIYDQKIKQPMRATLPPP